MRNWGLMEGVAQNNNVWLLSLDSSTGAIDQRLRDTSREIKTFPIPVRHVKQRVQQLLTSPLPDMAWRLWSPEFNAQFQHWVVQNRFDIVQIEGIEMARYALDNAILLQNHGAKIIFDDHNCEYMLQKRNCLSDMKKPKRWLVAFYSFIQWQRLQTFEQKIIANAHATACVSDEDRKALIAIQPHSQLRPIFSVPNGIHIAHYAQIQPAINSNIPNHQKRIVFTGKMDYRPNIEAVLWFCNEILPKVQAHHPQVVFYIVGQKPSHRLNVLKNHPNIVITGEVEDVRSFIATAKIYVAPLLVGGGTRFKLLEAMAMKIPIVTTSAGCEGFALSHTHSAMIANSSDTFAYAVIELLNNEHQRVHLANNAYSYAQAYDWQHITPKLLDIYQSI
jgi:glycosyltransferase involved in cell wall biosynthesis